MIRVAAIVDASTSIPGLEDLTMYRSVASIPFAGRYRLIDFVLSNIVNSGINSVGLFPSYPFVSLMDHVAMGKSWDLDRRKDGLFFLPPHQRENGHAGVGSFAALEEHDNFFTKSRQGYVVVTNTFTICQLDYADMLEVHVKSGMDITEAVSGGTALKSYIMSKDLLVDLIRTYRDKKVISVEDVVKLKKNPYTFGQYEYTGYFAIIDSIDSYFKESMALLNKEQWNGLFLQDRPIYTKVKDEPPTRYMEGSLVKRSLLANGSMIEGNITDSVINRAVVIKKGAKLERCIIMQKCVIGENCELAYVIADKDVHIEDGIVLRGTPEDPVVIRKGERIRKEDVR